MQYSEILDNLNPNISIAVRPTVYVQHKPFWSEKKTKLDATIWNVIKGNIFIEINNQKFSATVGDVIIFYPQTQYKAYTDNNGCEFLYNRFSLELGNNINLLEEINISGIIPAKYISSSSKKFCTEVIDKHLSNHTTSFEFYALFMSYLSKIINISKIYDYIHFPFGIKYNNKSYLHNTMVFMSEHFRNDLSIKELAKMANMSEKHFSTSFHQMLGLSPKQYIIQCRMNAAAKMLINTNNTISAIASELGYSDVYSFSKAFKKYYDEAPIDFRKQSNKF